VTLSTGPEAGYTHWGQQVIEMCLISVQLFSPKPKENLSLILDILSSPSYRSLPKSKEKLSYMLGILS
jgi:hypothetical protein